MRTPLQKNEKVLLVTRTSWITLVFPAFMIIISIVPVIFFYQQTLLVLLLPLAALSYFGWKWLERQHNLWAVSNFRVIDEFGVININTKESPLDKINNVSYSQTIWGRIFGYGNVEIQTAATIGETIYQFVEKPGLLKDTITTAQSEYKHAQFASQVGSYIQQSHQTFQTAAANSSHHQIATELEKLYELKQKGILSEEEYNRAKAKLLT